MSHKSWIMARMKTGNKKLKLIWVAFSLGGRCQDICFDTIQNSLLQMSRHLAKHYQNIVLPKLLPTNTYKLPLLQILAKTLFEHYQSNNISKASKAQTQLAGKMSEHLQRQEAPSQVLSSPSIKGQWSLSGQWLVTHSLTFSPPF